MPRSAATRLVRAIVVASFVAGASGCTSNEIPLIEFPKGPPPLPPPSKTALPQGSNTSQGEPSH